MPVIKKETTFMGWLEDFAKLPLEIPGQTIAVYRDNFTKDFVLLRVQARATTNVSDADMRLAFAQGSAEGLLDISGVNTTVTLVDFFKDPKKTSEKLLQSTRNDIFNLEELKQLRAGTVMGDLTKGIVVDEDGNDLTVPNSPILKAAGIRLPVTDSTGKSIFQTAVDITPSSSKATYEDRLAAENGETDTNPALKSYARLGEAVTRLASSGTAMRDRRSARNSALTEFHRSLGRELNLKLEETFSLKSADGTESKGRLIETLTKHNGDIDSFINNPAELGYILGLSSTELASMDSSTTEYLKRFTKAESLNIKLNGDPTVHRKIAENINKNPSRYGITVNPVTGDLSPTSAISTKTQDAWKNFLKPGQSAEDRIKSFEALRTSYLKNEPNGIPMYWTLTGDDLGLEITGTRYGGITAKTLYAEDMLFEYEKSLVEAEIWFDINRGKIRRDIFARIKNNPKLIKAADDLYNAEKAALLARGLSVTDAENAAKSAQDAFWSDKSSQTLERVSTAVRSLDLANDLFVAQTTEQLLESIAQGEFIKTGIVASRFFNALPFGPKELRGASNATAILDPSVYMTSALKGLGIMKADDVNINQTVGRIFGVAYEDNKSHRLLGVIPTGNLLENRAWIQHEHFRPDAASGKLKPSGDWKTIGFKHSDVEGYFGKNSLFDELFKMSSFGLGDPSQYLENPALLKELVDLADRMSAAGPTGYLSFFDPTNPQHVMAKNLGFHLGDRKKDVEAFVTNIRTNILSTDPATGTLKLKWLDDLFAKGKLPKGERWRLLIGINKNGYAGTLSKSKYIGILNMGNRIANRFRDWLYKSVLWGNFGSNIPILGKFIINPVREILSGIGFSDEVGMSTWVRRHFLNKVQRRGRYLSRALLRFSESRADPRATKTLVNLFGGKFGGALTRFIAKSGNRAVLQALGKVIAGLSGALTGGLSWVLTIFGGTLWKASMKIMKLDFKGVYYVVKEDLSTLINVAKKIIFYPAFFFCACATLPFILVMVVIIAIVTFFVRYDDPIGGGQYGKFESAKIVVSKTTTPIDADTIRFTVTVTKTAEEDVTIASFVDRLSYTPTCDINNGLTINFGDPAFVGTPDTTPGELALAFQGMTLTETQPSITASMVLDGITSSESTYTNMVEVTAVDDGSSSASDSAVHVIGEGGCATCPAGWPIQLPIKVTQGPLAGFSHASPPQEAVDFVATDGGGRALYATHNGVVRMPVSNSDCTKANTHPLGCHIRLESMDGNYQTIYAHLVGLNMSLKDRPVLKGEYLGQMGTTGNSTGPHLHYEFANVNYECVPGHPMRLRNVAGEQYVPETIERGCSGGSCTQSF